MGIDIGPIQGILSLSFILYLNYFYLDSGKKQHDRLTPYYLQYLFRNFFGLSYFARDQMLILNNPFILVLFLLNIGWAVGDSLGTAI